MGLAYPQLPSFPASSRLRNLAWITKPVAGGSRTVGRSARCALVLQCRRPGFRDTLSTPGESGCCTAPGTDLPSPLGLQESTSCFRTLELLLQSETRSRQRAALKSLLSSGRRTKTLSRCALAGPVSRLSASRLNTSNTAAPQPSEKAARLKTLRGPLLRLTIGSV